MATVGSRYGIPRRCACRVMPTSGSRRFRSTSTASALRGETYTIRVAGFFGAGENMRWTIAARNAASVFPDPVGARTRTLSPSAIAGHPSSCARVGVWNVASNHARVAGLKLASGSLPTNTEVNVPRMEIGLGVDSRFNLSQDDQRAIAEESAALGYTSLWTPIGNT